ncbi:GYD domain-containing protein [Edaphobacter bradus]|uniref:GYD domain-containing protein n=1 Tax=Edaphobacter bradus TaxID=2259016 RepID=UPI0021E0CEC6|nr:GYD domain-containing protein [Edaphobacter bradus]
MPTYISLCRWTQQGAQKVKESPARLDAARKAFQTGGVKMLHFFMTTGKYDMVIISEAPNDEALAKATLSLISQGNITTQTSRAFTETEYRSIMAAL